MTFRCTVLKCFCASSIHSSVHSKVILSCYSSREWYVKAFGSHSTHSYDLFFSSLKDKKVEKDAIVVSFSSTPVAFPLHFSCCCCYFLQNDLSIPNMCILWFKSQESPCDKKMLTYLKAFPIDIHCATSACEQEVEHCSTEIRICWKDWFCGKKDIFECRCVYDMGRVGGVKGLQLIGSSG